MCSTKNFIRIGVFLLKFPLALIHKAFGHDEKSSIATSWVFFSSSDSRLFTKSSFTLLNCFPFDGSSNFSMAMKCVGAVSKVKYRSNPGDVSREFELTEFELARFYYKNN